MAETNAAAQADSTTPPTPAAGQGQADPAVNPRTYTQEEVSAIAAKEAGRTDRAWLKLLGLGSKDEVQATVDKLKAAGSLSARAAAAEQERDALRGKLETASAQLTALQNAQTLAQFGVSDADEQEFLAYKIGKLAIEGKSFEDAAKEYFEAHPRAQGRVSVQLAPPQQGQAATTGLHDKINRLLRGET